MAGKLELRRLMRERLALPPDVRAERSARICAAIAGLPQWRAARTVALFAPQPREPDVDGLWAQAQGKIMAYPRMESESLALFTVESLYDLQPARWDLREPLPDHPIAPEEIDLVLVPGVAFTRAGARCGRGGGFYDRFLATLPAGTCKIGVCFALQIVEELPVEPHDWMMDLVVTEHGKE